MAPNASSQNFSAMTHIVHSQQPPSLHSKGLALPAIVLITRSNNIQAIRQRLLARDKHPLHTSGQIKIQGCTCETCNTALYRQVAESHRFDDDRKVFITGFGWKRHNVWFLAKLAVKSFESKRGMTRWGQMKALKDWREWWQQGRSANARLFQTMNLHLIDEQVFVSLAESLNQIFFCGTLPPAILRVCWVARPDAEKYHYGQMRYEQGMQQICLNPGIEDHLLNPRAVICTILHEMIHAYLGRYGCSGIFCKTELCRVVTKDNIGRTGHGRAWQYIAQAIESRLPALLGFKGRLGRQECTTQEISWPLPDLNMKPTEFGFRPSVCDINRFHDEYGGLMRRSLRRWFDDGDLPTVRPVWRPNKLQSGSKIGLRRRKSIAACQDLVLGPKQ